MKGAVILTLIVLLITFFVIAGLLYYFDGFPDTKYRGEELFEFTPEEGWKILIPKIIDGVEDC